MEITIHINTMMLIFDIFEMTIVFLIGMLIGYYKGISGK